MTEENNAKSPTIIEYGTKEFKDFVYSSEISPQDAYEKIQSGMEKYPEGKNAVYLYLIINNEYHFTGHANKLNNIWLSGFYVDATTGDVRFNSHFEQYKLKKINHSNYFEPKKWLFKGFDQIEK